MNISQQGYLGGIYTVTCSIQTLCKNIKKHQKTGPMLIECLQVCQREQRHFVIGIVRHGFVL